MLVRNQCPKRLYTVDINQSSSSQKPKITCDSQIGLWALNAALLMHSLTSHAGGVVLLGDGKSDRTVEQDVAGDPTNVYCTVVCA